MFEPPVRVKNDVIVEEVTMNSAMTFKIYNNFVLGRSLRLGMFIVVKLWCTRSLIVSSAVTGHNFLRFFTSYYTVYINIYSRKKRFP